MIEYRGVHKAFDGQQVLAGVDLRVEEGEMFGIFGPSGTGKSVLLKTTIGLVEPDLGDVAVEGEVVRAGDRRNLERVRHAVGYVFQNAALFDSLNVWENVEMGIPETELAGMSRLDRTRRIWRSLELSNLEPDTVVRKTPAELSGGMRKRVGIARAIVGRPRILLWDEPTTGLDPVNTAGVERLIEQLSEELNVTSVIVTHDIQGGLLMCDRVAMLQGGRLRFCGTPTEFRASEDPLVKAFADRTAAQAALDHLEIK
ncbi:MAG: ATP-binding cassette domain-containing protein [Gemmatimonadales bacterium]|nr:MAG: ATP-binding cassette domain-containing protein [Gemmatimonadales bacterium]